MAQVGYASPREAVKRAEPGIPHHPGGGWHRASCEGLAEGARGQEGARALSYCLVAVQLALPLRTHTARIVKVSDPDAEVGEANAPVIVSTKGMPDPPKLRPTIEKEVPLIGTGGASAPQGSPSKQP
jgi:hypothetical protein